MCQPSYRSPQTITNRSVKLCLIIYVLSYPAPHTNRSVKCPSHHTPHDHQQVSEVMSNNIIMSCPTLHPLTIDQCSTHHTPHNHQRVCQSPASQKVYIVLSCPSHLTITNRLMVSCFSNITPFGHQQVRRYVPLFCPIHHTSDKESPTGPWGKVQFALHYTCQSPLSQRLYLINLSWQPDTWQSPTGQQHPVCPTNHICHQQAREVMYTTIYPAHNSWHSQVHGVACFVAASDWRMSSIEVSNLFFPSFEWCTLFIILVQVLTSHGLALCILWQHGHS